VQLVKADAVQAEPPQAHLDLLPQVLRPAHWFPLAGAGPHQAALGTALACILLKDESGRRKFILQEVAERKLQAF
jgi:hypothetical protein